MIEEGEEVIHKTRGSCVVVDVLYMNGVFMGANLKCVITGKVFFEQNQNSIVGA